MGGLKEPGQANAPVPEYKQNQGERMLPIAVVALLAVLTVVGAMVFYRHLDLTLFQERSGHDFLK